METSLAAAIFRIRLTGNRLHFPQNPNYYISLGNECVKSSSALPTTTLLILPSPKAEDLFRKFQLCPYLLFNSFHFKKNFFTSEFIILLRKSNENYFMTLLNVKNSEP